MAIPFIHANAYLSRLFGDREAAQITESLRPKPELPAAPKLPRNYKSTGEMVARRWEVLAHAAEGRDALLDPATEREMARFDRNIENFIGTVKMPVGVAGPLRVNGLFAQGDYYVPLATTEAALVASYHRGAQLISRAGGATAMLLNEGVTRAPGFAFKDLRDVGAFVAWVVTQLDSFKAETRKTTRHGELVDMQVTVEGNHVYLRFDFRTGDASGQNMVTIATQSICEYIDAHCPVAPQYSFVEANLSGDKKATGQSFVSVRGKKVTCEVNLPAHLVQELLHTTPARMVDYWRMSALGAVLSATMGVQGHYANGLAALYIACGQDAACVAESAVGVTRFELTEEGGLYAAVTLPNLMLGTVGGGTGLPSQKACLDVLGLAGPGGARALAEVAAAITRAGELSIIGALSAGDFARAHQQLARG